MTAEQAQGASYNCMAMKCQKTCLAKVGHTIRDDEVALAPGHDMKLQASTRAARSSWSSRKGIRVDDPAPGVEVFLRLASPALTSTPSAVRKTPESGKVVARTRSAFTATKSQCLPARRTIAQALHEKSVHKHFRVCPLAGLFDKKRRPS